jgi:hypothetical protein
MMRIVLLVLILAGFPVIPLMSQKQAGENAPEKPLRIEIQARSVNETYRVILCGTNGLVMFFRSQEVADAARTKWYFTCYDTNFRQRWTKDVALFNDQDVMLQQTGTDTLALFFGRTAKSKNPDNLFEILRIIPAKGTLILNDGKLDNGALVDFFGFNGDRAWLGANIKGEAGKIVAIGLNKGRQNSFSLGNGSQISVLWLRPDHRSATVSAIVKRQVSKKSAEYYMVRYDTLGVIKREILIDVQSGERALSQFRVTETANGAELLLGSYSQGGTGSGQKNRPADNSTGFFSCLLENGAKKSLNFFNYLEFKNAASLVGENDIMNLQKKALKKNKTIGEYSLDYSVLLHPLLSSNDEHILSAEVFAPQYHTENFTDFDFYGRPYTNSYSVFDGYRFYHAVVAGFDAEGKMKWDNNVEIRNLVSFDLSPKTVIFPSESNMVLCYESDGKVGSQIISGNMVVEKLDFAVMEMLNPNDKLLSESKGIMESWYGNYFLAHGYQDIKNVALESNNKRLVFYFSKLRFEK